MAMGSEMSLGLDSPVTLKVFGHSITEVQMLLWDAGYHLYSLHCRGLAPIPAGAIIDGESVIACARQLEQYPW